MKLVTKILLTSSLLLLTSISSLNAQNWMVSVPVNVTLTSVAGYTGGCYPNGDYEFSFPGSQVTGVDFYLIVTATPPNVLIMPTADTIAIGDSILFQFPVMNDFDIYCFSGAGGLVSFDIKAIGTPTTAGQPHICSASQLWMSNLQLCPEGLINLNITSGCVVDPYVGINDPEQGGFQVVVPNAENGNTLFVNGQFDAAVITDITGRIIHSAPAAESTRFSFGGITSGIYFLQLRKDGKMYTAKFHVQ